MSSAGEPLMRSCFEVLKEVQSECLASFRNFAALRLLPPAKPYIGCGLFCGTGAMQDIQL